MGFVSFIEHIQQDLRFGFRMLVRSPGFSLLAILCLTVGIGANAAAFSWIEGILFRPYPRVAHQEQLMVLAGTSRGAPGYNEVSWPDFLDLRKNCKLVDAFIGEKIVGTTLSIGDRAEVTAGSIVSANYFDAIGVRPVLGRGFAPEEELGRSAHPVVVISHQLWKDRFRSDPAIIGKTQMLNGQPHTIVGVAPEGFYGTFVGYPFQFWVPASMQERFDSSGYKLEDRGARWVEGFVRLKPGVTAAQAQAEISGVASQLEAAYPETNRGRGIKLVPLWQSPFNNSGLLLPTLEVALAVVFFVLLIACANVGNLMLVRSFARRHEMTIRLAIGADRRRLLKQLLTEGLILSSVAAVGGLLLALWCRNALVRIIPPRGVQMRIAGDIDWRVLALSAAVCLISTLLFGLGSGDSVQQGRSRRRAEIRIRRCGECSPRIVDPLRPGCPPGGPQLHFAGRGRPADSEPAAYSKIESGLFNSGSAADLSQFVRGGVRYAARQKFPGPTAGPGRDAQWR